MKMRCLLAIVLMSALSMFSHQARAQFSQPPPDKSAPVCSEQKSSDRRCKELPLPADVAVSCSYYETGGELPLRVMYCTAMVWQRTSTGWTIIDPSLLKYYWASIVDGQEYYSAPMDSSTATVFCGQSGQGYVRVTAAGGTATTAFSCSGYSPGGQ